jgi:hypothetical protein
MKERVFGIMGVFLVFVSIFIACDNGTGLENTDNWFAKKWYDHAGNLCLDLNGQQNRAIKQNTGIEIDRIENDTVYFIDGTYLTKSSLDGTSIYNYEENVKDNEIFGDVPGEDENGYKVRMVHRILYEADRRNFYEHLFDTLNPISGMVRLIDEWYESSLWNWALPAETLVTDVVQVLSGIGYKTIYWHDEFPWGDPSKVNETHLVYVQMNPSYIGAGVNGFFIDYCNNSTYYRMLVGK